MLKDQVAAYEKRIKNLETFRDKFFALKRSYDRYTDLHATMSTKVETLIANSDHQQSEDLSRLLETIKGEKQRLEQELDLVGQEITTILSECEGEGREFRGRKQARSLKKQLDHVKEVIARQKSQICELMHRVEAGQIDAKTQNELKDQLQRIMTENAELVTALEVLQNEYDLLKKELSDMAACRATAEHKFTMETRTLREELMTLKQEHNQLVTEHAELEEQYLRLYEETRSAPAD